MGGRPTPTTATGAGPQRMATGLILRATAPRIRMLRRMLTPALWWRATWAINTRLAFSQVLFWITNDIFNGFYYPNGVYVGTQPGLMSGLAVQRNGNLLAVAVAPDNKVYLLDKLSGAFVTNFGVTAPGRMGFSPDGSLWVVSGGNVFGYTNLPDGPAVAATLAGFSKTLAVAVNPVDPNQVPVADGGASQQVKAFDSTGTALWTYGQAGGYQANGVAVTTDKFWFDVEGGEDTFVCFASDGSFWVGDGGNHRSLHFSAARDYLEEIMFQPHSYMTCVDQNNPARVFNQFLEFNVDYTSLPQAWGRW